MQSAIILSIWILLSFAYETNEQFKRMVSAHDDPYFKPTQSEMYTKCTALTWMFGVEIGEKCYVDSHQKLSCYLLESSSQPILIHFSVNKNVIWFLLCNAFDTKTQNSIVEIFLHSFMYTCIQTLILSLSSSLVRIIHSFKSPCNLYV